MKFLLSAPEHGWVELTVSDDDNCLEVSVSDVPNNFIDDLMIALARLLTHGDKQQIHLSLEPGYYLISLERQAADYVIAVAPEGAASEGLLYQARGTFQSIILPIFRSIKGFKNSREDDVHWPEINQRNFQNMAEDIARYKSRNSQNTS